MNQVVYCQPRTDSLIIHLSSLKTSLWIRPTNPLPVQPPDGSFFHRRLTAEIETIVSFLSHHSNAIRVKLLSVCFILRCKMKTKTTTTENP